MVAIISRFFTAAPNAGWVSKKIVENLDSTVAVLLIERG